MTESDKAVMQEALRVLIRYGADTFDSGKPVVVALRKAISQSKDKTMTDQKINTLWADALKYADPTAGNAHLIFARSLLAQSKETK